MHFVKGSIFEATKESLQLAIQAKLINNKIHQRLLRHYLILHSQYHLEVSKILKSQFIRNFVIYDRVVLQILAREHPFLGLNFMYERKLLNLRVQHSFEQTAQRM